MTSSSAPSQRLDLLHILRGIAAMLVLFGHVSVATKYAFPYVLNAFGHYQNLGVYVFFVISGFVVPWSLQVQRYTIRQFPRYMLRRLVRLDPPYLAMVAVGLGVAAVHSRHAGTPFPFTASTIALHLGYLAGLADRPWIVSVFWTLGIEFQFYILMGLVFPLFALVPGWVASETRVGPATLGLSSRIPTDRGLLLATAAFVLIEITLVFVFSGAGWTYYSGYFIVGILAFAVRASGLHWAALVAYGFAGAGVGGFTLPWTLVVVVGLLVVALPDRLPWVWDTWPGKCLSGLGQISYSLYLTHPVVVGLLTVRAARVGWMSTAVKASAVYAAEVVLCLGVATVFYYVCERPAVRLSHRVKFRPAPAS